MDAIDGIVQVARTQTVFKPVFGGPGETSVRDLAVAVPTIFTRTPLIGMALPIVVFVVSDPIVRVRSRTVRSRPVRVRHGQRGGDGFGECVRAESRQARTRPIGTALALASVTRRVQERVQGTLRRTRDARSMGTPVRKRIVVCEIVPLSPVTIASVLPSQLSSTLLHASLAPGPMDFAVSLQSPP